MAQAEKKYTASHEDSSADDASKMAFSAEISKVLKLMIHSLYTNHDIFLRELISNASDACDKLRYRALTEPNLLDGASELSITIAMDKEQRVIEVRDTGIGMNREDVITNLGTIAKSGTEEFIAQLSGNKEQDVSLIGQFGVGFYSSFMIADKVEVLTRKAGEDSSWYWCSEGDGTFIVRPSDETLERGTIIRLHVRNDAEANKYLDHFKLRFIAETYSDHISFPIYQMRPDHEGTIHRELVNEGGALWTKQKSEISDEQYQEFYHHVAHSPDEPWLTLHNKVEGKATYTNLLFVPSRKPFDLFHPERRRRVKLYVKRVFITEENIDLIPHYLRFLRGIIDSDDLPLNISRETLQDNPKLRQIRESVTNKVLTEIKRKAEHDAEGYSAFWSNFGAVIKEGLCEMDAPKDKILEVCRFASTATTDLVSLKEYLSRKPENQEHIFVLSADSLESAQRSPLLEGFKKRNIEVLLLTDHVDDFWLNVVSQYENMPFKSITRADIDLDAIMPLPHDEHTNDADDASMPKTTLDDTQQERLLTQLHACYDAERIKQVRPSSKLTDALACLAVDDGSMDMRMERFLIEHNQLPRRSAKILEVNIAHPLFSYMARIMDNESKQSEFDACAQLVLDQSYIIEGEPVSDPASFAKRFGMIMVRAFAG